MRDGVDHRFPQGIFRKLQPFVPSSSAWGIKAVLSLACKIRHAFLKDGKKIAGRLLAVEDVGFSYAPRKTAQVTPARKV